MDNRNEIAERVAGKFTATSTLDIKAAVKNAYGSLEDTQFLLAYVMDKKHLQVAEDALAEVGGRAAIQGIWKQVTRLSMDLRSITRKMR